MPTTLWFAEACTGALDGVGLRDAAKYVAVFSASVGFTSLVHPWALTLRPVPAELLPSVPAPNNALGVLSRQ